MVDTICRKNIKLFGLGLLILSTLACNLLTTSQAKPTAIKPTSTLKEEAEVIFPTKAQATATQTETIEVLSTEIPTLQSPTAVSAKKTATKQAVKPSPTRTVPPPTATPVVIRQSTLAVQPTSASISSGAITVTAATGNLFVRRGPGTTYNIVGGFSKGVTTKAVGRNEKNDWLAIEIPLAKGAIGWISMGTGYTEMSGSIQSLPLYKYDEPKAAYLMNCTLHDMTTKPGQWNLPAKTTQKVNPGEYAILDMYTGQNKVQDVVLKEGNTVAIKVDGDGLSNSCP